MPEDKGGISGLPSWPEDAKELPGNEPTERYFWFYLAPMIGAGLGLVRAIFMVLFGKEPPSAEVWGMATGMVVAAILPALFVGYFIDRSRWMRNRQRRE